MFSTFPFELVISAVSVQDSTFHASFLSADGTLAAGIGLTGYYIYAFASPMFAADDAVVAAAQ